MSDQSHRTLNYVEVIYFDEKGQYKSRKQAHYPVEESEVIYQRTINKMKEEKLKALVCLRQENHELLKIVNLTPKQ